MRFTAYDAEASSPEGTTFQIAHKNRTYFLKIGDVVPGTTFKLTRFERKMRKQPNAAERDVSELTVTDSISGKVVVLIIPPPIEGKVPQGRA